MNNQFPALNSALAELSLLLDKVATIQSERGYDINYLRGMATNALTGGFGVIGDGVANDTNAINIAITAALASNTNLWQGYHCLYFPGATYLIQGVNRPALNGLYIFGDGEASLWKKPDIAGDRPIATFTGATRFRMTDMALDFNHTDKYGGFKFYRAHDLHIERNHFFDSNPIGYATQVGDRYAFVLGAGVGEANISTDVYFGRNVVSDLQCEFDHVRRARIEYNKSFRCPTTAAFGTFSVNDDAICEDVTYEGNECWDFNNKGICAVVDSSTHDRMHVRRLKIIGNKFYVTRSTVSEIIHVGATSTAGNQLLPVFEDIFCEGNEIWIAPQVGTLASHCIWFLGGQGSNIVFQRGSISNNRVYGNRRANVSVQSIQGRWLSGYRVNSNLCVNAYEGLGLSNCTDCKIEDNLVEAAAIAYRITDLNTSSWVGNRYSGTPADALFTNVAGLAEPTESQPA